MSYSWVDKRGKMGTLLFRIASYFLLGSYVFWKLYGSRKDVRRASTAGMAHSSSLMPAMSYIVLDLRRVLTLRGVSFLFRVRYCTTVTSLVAD